MLLSPLNARSLGAPNKMISLGHFLPQVEQNKQRISQTKLISPNKISSAILQAQGAQIAHLHFASPFQSTERSLRILTKPAASKILNSTGYLSVLKFQAQLFPAEITGRNKTNGKAED